ncbi:Rv3235 family protein [Blastococcus sp. URHD0036]|uniref:Rv3235 family protein n=1 Tax=Blastococcus sp. URHD0036 TaxID=1380356 RepID=UPI0004954D7D|nr:Rv3235 family protein [Blastococcus sp. URHD0036]
MTAPPSSAPVPGVPLRTFRLTVVPTPQPPLGDEPLTALVRHGIAPPRPRYRPGPRPREAHRRAADFGPTWSARSDLPDPALAGRRLLLLVLEGLAGLRPLSQVQPMTAPNLYAGLAHRRPPAWCAGGGTAPVLLGPVRVCEPVDGVAEISVVARRSGRAHAVAARLEGIDGRWRCTALQIG